MADVIFINFWGKKRYNISSAAEQKQKQGKKGRFQRGLQGSPR